MGRKSGRRGFGNIRKLPSGNYQASYQDPSWTGPGRAPRIKARHTFPTKAEAGNWLAKRQAEVSSETWKHPDQVAAEEAAKRKQERLEAVTLSQWFDQWVEDKTPAWKPNTTRIRQGGFDKHIRPPFGDTRLIDLDGRTLVEWLKTVPAGTRDSIKETLSAVLNAAMRSPETAIIVSPLQGFTVPKAETRGERYLFSLSEVTDLTEAITPRGRALVVLIADAGLRIGEALALNRSDIDLKGGWVNVTKTMVRIKGQGSVPGPPKTKNSYRRVQLQPATIPELTKQLGTYAQPGRDGAVFTNMDGRRAEYVGVVKWLRKAIKAANIQIPPGEFGGWHALRHYSATLFGNAGTPASEMMRRYGWTSMDMAARYVHTDDEQARLSADRVSKLVAPDVETWVEREERLAAAAGNVTTIRRRTA